MKLSRSRPEVMIATWFWSGYARKAPGTAGSLAALPFAYLLKEAGGALLVLAAAAFLFAAGLWAIGRLLQDNPVSDPQEIVIDEVVGQWLALAIAPPGWLAYVLGFLFFRLFDILKPWPVSWADSKVGGALGVMLDDVLAGFYAMATLAVLMAVLGMLGIALPGLY